MHEAVHEIRDAIYGFVRLSKREWEVVKCPAYQRLRDIRQLAMGHMVYPGANHTRFEHSIGCLHLSTEVLSQLREKSGEALASDYGIEEGNYARLRQILRLAALLHDVGHPPFSHSGEDLLPVRKDPKGRAVTHEGRPVKIDHEEMSVRIIRETEIRDVIVDKFGPDGITPEDVIAVATKPSLASPGCNTAHHVMLNTILTGDLGSDRIDYLLRDAYHSGQKTGDFDYRRLLGAMALVPAPGEEGTGTILGVDDSGWLVAEQMIVARYLMYVSLYFHKTKRIYEKHLEHFMKEWLSGRGGHLPEDIDEYVSMTDSTVLAAMGAAAVDSKAAGHGTAKRFRERGHMRLAKEIILADNYLPLDDGRRVPDKRRMEKLGLHIRRKFGKEAVLIDVPDHTATKMFDKSRILIGLSGRTRYLDEISEIVRGMSSKIWRGRIYAEHDRRSDVRTACDEWLGGHGATQDARKGRQ
jgi:uncharacterized protein